MSPRQRKNNSMLPFKKRIPEYNNDPNLLCLRSKKQYARINTQEKTQEKTQETQETQEKTQETQEETLKQLYKANKDLRKYKKKYKKQKKQMKKITQKKGTQVKTNVQKTMLAQTRSTQSNPDEKLLKGRVIIIKGKYKGKKRLIRKIGKRLCNSGCEWHYELIIEEVEEVEEEDLEKKFRTAWFTIDMLKSLSIDLT